MKKSNSANEYISRLENVRKEKNAHKGEWITLEAAEEYFLKANALSSKNPVDVGERRQLRIELQERYGLLEIEAINILNGNGIGDYVNKYYRIKNEIVASTEGDTDFQIWLKNEFAKQDFDTSKNDGWVLEED